MAKQRKAPPNCYWRYGELWGRIKVKGREIRWSLRTSDAKVAVSRVRARQEREVAHAHYGDARRTWDDACVAWADHIAANVGASTARRYAVSLGQIRPFLMGAYLDEIDGRMVTGIVASRRRSGVANATIKRDLTALSSVLAHADVDANPALKAMRKVKERRDPITLPSDADILRVIDRAPGMFADLIKAAWLTGCRQNELVTLKRADVNHQRRQLTVIGKGNKRRTLDLSFDAYAVFSKLPVSMASQWVFWHGAGMPYANVSSRFRVFVKAALKGARGFRFHDLRHKFAVDYLKAGGSIYTLQQHMGHSSVKVTEGYLAHLTADEAGRAKENAG